MARVPHSPLLEVPALAPGLRRPPQFLVRAFAHEWLVLGFSATWLALLAAAQVHPRLRGVVNTLYFVIGFVTVWALFRAAAHPRVDRATARAWRLLGVAASTIIVSGATWTAYLALNPGAESPPWSDWLTLSYLPLAAAGFLSFPGDQRITLRDRRAALDAALLCVGGVALIWYFYIGRTILQGVAGLSLYDYFSSVSVWVVLLAVSAAYLRTTDPMRRTAIALCMAAEVLFSISDFIWSAQATPYRPGDGVDALYFGVWLCRWAAARWAWHGAAAITLQDAGDAPVYRSGIAPAAFVAGAYTMLLVAVLSDSSATVGERVGFAAVCTVMTWLLVARQVVELMTTRDQSRALEVQKERFRSVVESATDYIFVVDAASRVVWASASARRAYALSAQPPILELTHPDDVSALLAWLPGNQHVLAPQAMLVRLRRADGDWEHVELRGHDVRHNPCIAGIVINGRNRTEEVALEDLVRHAEKLATLHDMAGRIAHAFNNALTVVQGHAELLASDPALNESWYGDVAEIRGAAGRGAAITRQLLGYSGRQVVQPEALDASAVVGDMLATWRRLMPAGITVRVEGDAGAARVVVDRAQLEQVLFNLVVNARDAMPVGGVIVIGVGAGAVADQSMTVELSVADSGVGMDAEQQARMFEPFYTTKAPGKGTGLGLAMVDTIVRRAGGLIAVTSAVGAGSTFLVSLPAVPAAAAVTPTDDREVAATVLSPRGVVLLVDDEDAVRTVTQRLLLRAGCDVIAASGGGDALALLAAAGQTVDVVVTDMMMPGMSGRELISRLVVAHPHLPIICITGFTAGSDAGVALPAQVQRVIEKPFESVDLIGAVRRAVERRRSTPSP